MEESPLSEREALLLGILPVMELLHQNLCQFFLYKMFLHNKYNGATEVGGVGTTVAQARGSGGAQLMNATETTKLVDFKSFRVMMLTTIAATATGPNSNSAQNMQDWMSC